MRMPTRTLTMMDVVFPREGLLRDVALVVGFSLITALCAQIAIWIGLIPITGQTLGVLLSGALLGSRRGALSQVVYLGWGAMGLPVFASGFSGIPYMLGPTGGFLMGFVVAAFVVGLLTEQGWDRRFWTAAAAMLVGNIVLYLFGLLWLTRFVPANQVLAVGLYPFIPGDLIKLVLAAVALPSGWALLRSRKK